MSPLEALSVLVAGMGAGAINTLVGSGTLITFPTLLAVGYSPVTANVSNNVGLVPGGFSGALGYRRELEGQRGRAMRLGTASVIGAIVGATLLLSLPADWFKRIVPAFIAIALVLIVFQPQINRVLDRRRTEHRPHGGPLTLIGVCASGVYGGYFGAAQGIMLLAILGLSLPEDLQRINALKNVLALMVNIVAGAVFVAVAHIAWGAAALIACGSIAGAFLAARYGRHLPAPALRALIVVVGVSAIVRLL